MVTSPKSRDDRISQVFCSCYRGLYRFFCFRGYYWVGSREPRVLCLAFFAVFPFHPWRYGFAFLTVPDARIGLNLYLYRLYEEKRYLNGDSDMLVVISKIVTIGRMGVQNWSLLTMADVFNEFHWVSPYCPVTLHASSFFFMLFFAVLHNFQVSANQLSALLRGSGIAF